MLPPSENVLLVLVGAGASFACVPFTFDEEVSVLGFGRARFRYLRPPLTAGLVEPSPVNNWLTDRHPGSQSVIDDLRRRMAESSPSEVTSIETALGEYGDRANADDELKHHLVAMRMYCRDRLRLATEATLSPGVSGGITTYTSLVALLRQWAKDESGHVCFVNFNYDLLLETACQNGLWGLSVNNVDTYTSDRYMSVLKPHGSINWAYRVADNTLSSLRAADAIAVQGSTAQTGQIEESGLRELKQDESPGNYVHPAVPAVALPTAAKSSFVWPQSQSDFFDNLGPCIPRVLTIGWRGAEPHFVPRLMGKVWNTSRILVCSPSEQDANEVRTNLRGVIEHNPRTTQHRHGFESLVGSEALETFLSDV
jgi:hypothetical protein